MIGSPELSSVLQRVCNPGWHLGCHPSWHLGWRASRRRLLALTATLLTLASAQTTLCATPGKDGPLVVPSGGVVNTYYPGTTVSAGSTSLSLSTPLGDTSKAIAVGDLLLVIQMQDADLNVANSSAYGTSTVNKSGLYEYVVAKSALAANTAGSVTIGGTGANGGLLRDYTTSAAGTQGQRRFQVIRVPQYSSASFTSALTALPWNGAVGGILAMDVAGQANLNGATVSVSGLGFRGGGGRGLLGGAVGGVTPTNDDYRFLTSSPLSSTVGRHGSKGEGIAGTPRAVNTDTSKTDTSLIPAPTILDTAAEGYPSGSAGRGAPGNAGGGGTDDEVANANNAGGGGGSNGGAGGRGGDGYNGTDTIRPVVLGGFGGADFTLASAARIVLGGGGGAGSSNNNPSGGQTPVSASGARGGGLILLRTGSLTGSGTFNANGNDAPDYEGNDAAGGGGAGGSVLVYAASTTATLSVNARGGAGGDADSKTFITPHGPGGGGGGGVVYTNFSPVVNVSGGANGLTPLSATTTGPLTTANATAFASTPGAAGESGTLVASPTATGVGPTVACLPQLTVSKTTSTPSRIQGVDTTANYTITVTNAANQATATEVVLSDALPTPFTYASTGTVTLAGGATRPTTTTPTAGTTSPSWGTFTLPAGGSVTLPFTVNLNAAAGTYQNPATATYLDPQRTTTTGTTSASYVAASSTAEDVTVGLQLSGRVYGDANGSGTLDGAETGLAGVTVQLYDAAGTTLIRTVTSDGNGNYSFPVSAATSYTVVVPTAPAGQGPTSPSPARRSVTVAAVNLTGQDFGFTAVPTCASGSLLAVGRDATTDLGFLYGVNLTSGVVGPLLKTLATQTSAVARDPNTGRVYYATRSAATPTVSDLRAVDLTTGQDVVVGTVSGITGGQVFTRMAINASGVGYLMIADGSALYSFTTGAGNTSTITNLGSVTTTSGVAIASYGSGDMAIDGSGTVWAVFTNNATNEAILFTIDPATRSAVPVERITVGGVTATLLFNGLAFSTSGTLYATTGNDVYTIDPANAVASRLTAAANSNSTTDLASCVYPVISPTIALTKTANVSVAKPGDTLTYTITATNTGTAAATGVQLTDVIPANTTYVAGTTTTNGVVTPDAAGPTMPYAAGGQIGSAGSFPSVIVVGAGKAVTVTFQVRVNTPYPDGAAGVSNTANVTYSGGPSGGLNTPPATTAIGTDLVVTKTGPQFASAGRAISYTVTVTNAGLRGANGAVLRDPAVSNWTATGVTCVASGGAVCPAGLSVSTLQAGLAVATFPAGGSLLLTVTGSVGTGTIVNGATITVPNTLPELNPTNNSAAATTQVINLVLTKEVRNCGPILPAAACPASAVWSVSGVGKPGDVLEYRVSYLNSGTANATALVIADPVPSNTTAQLNGYGTDGTGKALGLSWVVGAVAPVLLTSIAADDVGSLGTTLNLNVGTVVPGASGNVSFRAVIR